MGGAKTDKTALALIEYYPDQNKIFLSQITDKIKSVGDVSGDLVLYEEIQKHEGHIDGIGINAPLSLPKCLRCPLECPGFEVCTEEEILWMWEQRKKLKSKKKNLKLFSPYVERCVEHWLSLEIEEDLQPQNAFGANMAPLYARAHYLQRRLKMDCIEVFPKLSLWRIGRALLIQKSYLRFHKHAVGGEEARQAILQSLVNRDIAFLYEQDIRLMTKNAQAFDAFICALTALLKQKGQCEPRPKDFPSEETWIEVPKQDIIW